MNNNNNTYCHYHYHYYYYYHYYHYTLAGIILAGIISVGRGRPCPSPAGRRRPAAGPGP